MHYRFLPHYFIVSLLAQNLFALCDLLWCIYKRITRSSGAASLQLVNTTSQSETWRPMNKRFKRAQNVNNSKIFHHLDPPQFICKHMICEWNRTCFPTAIVFLLSELHSLDLRQSGTNRNFL